jgi:hypothetical protein
MKCDICEEENRENVGMRSAEFSVCIPCIDTLIKHHMQLLGRC